MPSCLRELAVWTEGFQSCCRDNLPEAATAFDPPPFLSQHFLSQLQGAIPWLLSSTQLHSYEVTSNVSQQHMLPGTGAKAEAARKGEDPTEVCVVVFVGGTPAGLWDRASAGCTAGVSQVHTAFSGLHGSRKPPQLDAFFS